MIRITPIFTDDGQDFLGNIVSEGRVQRFISWKQSNTALKAIEAFLGAKVCSDKLYLQDFYALGGPKHGECLLAECHCKGNEQNEAPAFLFPEGTGIYELTGNVYRWVENGNQKSQNSYYAVGGPKDRRCLVSICLANGERPPRFVSGNPNGCYFLDGDTYRWREGKTSACCKAPLAPCRQKEHRGEQFVLFACVACGIIIEYESAKIANQELRQKEELAIKELQRELSEQLADEGFNLTLDQDAKSLTVTTKTVPTLAPKFREFL